MTLFIRRGSASSSGCWNSQAECHDTTGVISRNKPSAWHSLTPHQTLPRAPQARPRISQEASTSSSQADHAQPHGQQYPMHPPARPAPPTGGGFLELLHSQPTEMVSHFLIWSFLYGHLYMVILLCLQSVS